jgi:RNA polymerase sigma-70 factor, ECF subfamily
MEEREALGRLKQGDIEALASLVPRYQLRAVRAAYLVTRDVGLAEEVVQAAWVRAFERIHQFDASRPFGPWFLRMVTNQASNMLARRGREVPLPEDSDARVEVDRSSPEAQFQQAETADAVWAALGKLPVAQRVAVVQRYYLGLSEAEMSDAQQCPPNTIKWRLHAGRERLRGLLRPLMNEPEAM